MSTPKVRLQFTVNESEVYTNFSHLIAMLLPTMQRLAKDFTRAQTILQAADADGLVNIDNNKKAEEAYEVLTSIRGDLYEVDHRLEEVQSMINGYREAKTGGPTPSPPAATSWVHDPAGASTPSPVTGPRPNALTRPRGSDVISDE